MRTVSCTSSGRSAVRKPLRCWRGCSVKQHIRHSAACCTQAWNSLCCLITRPLWEPPYMRFPQGALLWVGGSSAYRGARYCNSRKKVPYREPLVYRKNILPMGISNMRDSAYKTAFASQMHKSWGRVPQLLYFEREKFLYRNFFSLMSCLSVSPPRGRCK